MKSLGFRNLYIIQKPNRQDVSQEESNTCISFRLRQVSYQVLCQLKGLGLLILILSFSSCSKRYDDLPAFWPVPFDDSVNYSVGRFKSSYLADQIDHYYRGQNPGILGVTTFVNIDDLQNTSTFGRMYGEQLMSELTMRGFDVVELRYSDALQFINASGEFSLSRNPGFVRREQNLSGVVVGTYTVSPVRVYVNARLIDPTSARILSAGSVEMAKTSELTRMLRSSAFGSSLERIPVRHLGLSTYPISGNPNPAGKLYDLEERDGPGGHLQGPASNLAPLFVEPKVVVPQPKAKVAHRRAPLLPPVKAESKEENKEGEEHKGEGSGS